MVRSGSENGRGFRRITGLALIVLLAGLCLPPAFSGSESADAEKMKPGPPATCERIVGTGAISFTMDEGLTLTETRPLMGTSYSSGLAVLDLPNTLLAMQLTSEGNHLLRSEDAGCRWSKVEQLEDWSLLRLTAAPGGEAYAWARGREGFYRIEGDEIEARTAPGDPRRVWARANLESLDRQILVSEDGGASFDSAVQQGAQATDQNGIARTVTLTNTPTMEAHPDDPGVLYFVFGTYFQGHGTDLFRYDLLLDELSVVHIDGLDGIDAIAFSPVDPAVIYVGLEEEQVN